MCSALYFLIKPVCDPVTPRSANIGSRPGHRFEDLRTLDVTLTYLQIVMTKDITQGLHDALSSLASTTLQSICLELDGGGVTAPGRRDIRCKTSPPAQTQALHSTSTCAPSSRAPPLPI